MSNLIKILLLVALNLTANIFIKCERGWKYDLISIEVENNTPDKVFVDLDVTRPARGVFAIGGFLDIRQDIPNSLIASAVVFYSFTSSQFIRTPFHIPAMNLEKLVNSFYKDIIMESMINCTDNAPVVDGKFVAPLTKRTIHFHDCIVSNENMPSRLKNGYYKVVIRYSNFAKGKVELLCEVFSNS